MSHARPFTHAERLAVLDVAQTFERAHRVRVRVGWTVPGRAWLTVTGHLWSAAAGVTTDDVDGARLGVRLPVSLALNNLLNRRIS